MKLNVAAAESLKKSVIKTDTPKGVTLVRTIHAADFFLRNYSFLSLQTLRHMPDRRRRRRCRRKLRPHRNTESLDPLFFPPSFFRLR